MAPSHHHGNSGWGLVAIAALLSLLDLYSTSRSDWTKLNCISGIFGHSILCKYLGVLIADKRRPCLWLLVGVAEVGGAPPDETTGVGVTAKVMVELDFGVWALLESIEDLESDMVELE